MSETHPHKGRNWCSQNQILNNDNGLLKTESSIQTPESLFGEPNVPDKTKQAPPPQPKQYTRIVLLRSQSWHYNLTRSRLRMQCLGNTPTKLR